MKRKAIAILIGFVVSVTLFGQTLEEGKKFLYYERYKSALEVFQKIVAAKPGDANAVYWLGQAYIGNDNLPSAKNLYDQFLQNNAGDALVIVGRGHVQLLEKNKDGAKENFEKALDISKSKKGIYNTDILLAVGRANADGDNKTGDAPYAVEKLKMAAEQDKKNPEPELLLGICYLKMGREFGTDAVLAFREATVRDPSYAKAYYRVGRIFQVQKSPDLMSEEYDKAIKADPAFALPYLSYFLYYQYKDVDLAKSNLDKYVANSDKDCNSDYYLADYLYRAGKYNESLSKIKLMEAGACKDFARLNILYAYNYDKLNDAADAQVYLDKYFAAMKPDKMVASDYDFAAKFYSKTSGNEVKAINYYKQAAELSTDKNEKSLYLSTAVKIATAAKLLSEQINLITQIALIKGGLQENDYYAVTKSAVDAKEWVLADSLSNAYINAFPDKPQGYGFNVSVAKAMDADTAKGLAINPINRYNEFLLKDVEKNKKTIYTNYYYLLIYYAQKTGDLKTAIDLTGKMMELYKEGEEFNFAKTINEQLVKKLGKVQK
ncbi:MAG: tetratricopeptide repeat protein [Sphingobacteriales bacterium]|nr:tetratricopeptide repeat protein [Sphingobacteriales bacterium]